MPSEENLIKSANLVRVREVDFALAFTENLNNFIKALGITRKVAKAAGTELVTYYTEGVLQDGTVAEGEDIPLSQYQTKKKKYKNITIQKHRKATTLEAIVDKGFDQAVNQTTEKMIKDVQKKIKTNFFTFMGTGTGSATGTGLQQALAHAWGQLEVKYKDTEYEAVHFINPLDVADYLGTAAVTTQTVFGMRYIEDFLGLGTVFLSADVTQGTIISTAKDNIVLYYINVKDTDIGGAFSFTSDETGYIGIHEDTKYLNMTSEDYAIYGIELFAERLDGIILTTISPAAAAAEIA